jgi:hypothetical protein
MAWQDLKNYAGTFSYGGLDTGTYSNTYGREEPEEELDFYERERRRIEEELREEEKRVRQARIDPLQATTDMFRFFAESGKSTGASFLASLQGHEGASVVDRGWADKWIDKAQEDADAFSKEILERYGDRLFVSLPYLGDITMEEIANMPSNIGFSAVSKGVGAAGFVGGGLVGGPVGGGAGTFGGSYTVAHRMASYDFMDEVLKTKNEEMLAERGREITIEEERQYKKDFAIGKHYPKH